MARHAVQQMLSHTRIHDRRGRATGNVRIPDTRNDRPGLTVPSEDLSGLSDLSDIRTNPPRHDGKIADEDGAGRDLTINDSSSRRSPRPLRPSG